MNIVETLTQGIRYEEKVSLIFQRILSSPKTHPESQGLWKEVVAQKEKQILLIKKALQDISAQGPNMARIRLVSPKEMEAGLAGIETIDKKYQENEPFQAGTREMIFQIVSFEFETIFSPLFKIFDSLFVKGEPPLTASLIRQVELLNLIFKKHRLPSLSALAERYSFWVKKESKKKDFTEELFFKMLSGQNKPVTLRLRDGRFFSGRLAGFDQFSISCLGEGSERDEGQSRSSANNILFLKEAILSIQIDD
jgi:small nuclear ribonucleoprotein (snRNP)-like protein